MIRHDAKPRRGYAAVALWNPKNPVNVGGAMRAMGCYAGDMLIVSGSRRIKSMTHLSADPGRAWRHIPTIQTIDPFDAMPLGAMPVAIEIRDDAIALPRFIHPERAFYLFGPEDGSLPDRLVARCRYKVAIPTMHCMNLASTVNVVLYDRMAKAMTAVAPTLPLEAA